MYKYTIPLIMLAAALSHVRADHFVAQNGQTPVWPHTNWTMAASNIQDAVDAAVNGAVVWVDDGVYTTPTNAFTNTISVNVVYVNKAITLRSVNGATTTIIDGGGSNRCVYFALTTAVCEYGPLTFDGFTVTNGYAVYGGGGILFWGQSAGTATVQNCVITGNTMQFEYAGSYAGGGGLYCYSTLFSPVISNCVVSGNRALAGSQGSPDGGGLWFRALSLIVDSTFANNSAADTGGAMYFSTPWSVVDRCTVVSNTSTASGGGVHMHGGGGDLRNSLFAWNSGSVGGGVFCYYGARTFNCTIVSNSSASQIYIRGTVTGGDMQNNIIQSLAVVSGAVITGYNNCLPSLPGVGEWNNTLVTTNNPDYIGFVDWSAGNFRLRRDSPCVNAGINQPDWLAQSRDLDGRSRVDRMSGVPDMGCYEYVPRGAIVGLR